MPRVDNPHLQITVGGKAVPTFEMKYSDSQPRVPAGQAGGGEFGSGGGAAPVVHDYGPGKVYVDGVNTNLNEQIAREVARAGEGHAAQIYYNARWTGGHEEAVRGNLEKNANRYKEPQKLIELGRHLGIAHIAMYPGNRSFASLQKEHEAMHATGFGGRRVSLGNGRPLQSQDISPALVPGHDHQAVIPHSHEGGDAWR